MNREEKLREIAEQEQALMREIYGFDAGVKWAEERIIKLLEEKRIFCVDDFDCFLSLEQGGCNCEEIKALIKGETE